jgi:hypothetical protein
MYEVIIPNSWEIHINSETLRLEKQYSITARPLGKYRDVFGKIGGQDPNYALPPLEALGQKYGLPVGYGAFGHALHLVPGDLVAVIAAELAAELESPVSFCAPLPKSV